MTRVLWITGGGTFLFNSTEPYALTAMGSYFKNDIMSSHTPIVDLFPYRVSTEPGSPVISPSETITPVVRVAIANAGNSIPMRGTEPLSVTIRFFDVTEGSKSLIGETVLPPFPGCGTLRDVRVAWPNLSPGTHVLRIEVDPERQIPDISKVNNVMTTTVFIGTRAIYLPQIRLSR